MSLFDALTGSSAKKAAAENSARLKDLKTEGMGYYDTGMVGSMASLDKAAGAYQPLAQKYGAGSDLYLDSLGVNGAEGNQRAVSAFQTSPGYEFAMNQGLDALDRRAASRGMLASGNTNLDTINYATGLANQQYGNWQQNLAGLINPEMAATSGIAGVETGRAGLYNTDAQNRVGLASGITSGLNSQATQAANAEMQGSANLFGLGMNLAKLGTSMPGMMPKLF